MKTHIIFLLSSFYIWSKPNYWNQFRGPNGDGDAKSSNLPVKFSEKQHMTWKTPMPGKAWSSPVVMDNVVWFTNAEEGGHKMWAVQLDWRTGKELRKVLV